MLVDGDGSNYRPASHPRMQRRWRDGWTGESEAGEGGVDRTLALGDY